MKFSRSLIISVISLTLLSPVVETSSALTTSVQAQSVKSKQKVIRKRAKKESKELKAMDDYPLLAKYTLNFNKGKLVSIQIWCDESLANSDENELKHYFSYGVQVGMSAIKSTSKSPIVQVYSGNQMVAKSDFSNNMTFKAVD